MASEELGEMELHCGWLVKSPPLERTATTILKAVRIESVEMEEAPWGFSSFLPAA